MKSAFIALFLVFASIGLIAADGNWPKEIKAKSGAVITIYQPQPQSLQGDKLIGRAAFSVKEKPGNELIFGVFWAEAAFGSGFVAIAGQIVTITSGNGKYHAAFKELILMDPATRGTIPKKISGSFVCN